MTRKTEIARNFLSRVWELIALASPTDLGRRNFSGRSRLSEGDGNSRSDREGFGENEVI
ncbi:MAG: hypothetical protein ACP5D7_10175 [Limnospira sp.]